MYQESLLGTVTRVVPNLSDPVAEASLLAEFLISVTKAVTNALRAKQAKEYTLLPKKQQRVFCRRRRLADILLKDHSISSQPRIFYARNI